MSFSISAERLDDKISKANSDSNVLWFRERGVQGENERTISRKREFRERKREGMD